MIQKLRRKFILVNMSIVTVMLLLVFALVIQSTQLSMEQQNQQIMQRSYIIEKLQEEKLVEILEAQPLRSLWMRE